MIACSADWRLLLRDTIISKELIMASNNTLTKAYIVSAIHEKLDRTSAEVKSCVENLLRLMKQAIKKDSFLLLSGFGKFEAYSKRARKGRNPVTGDGIILPPRRVPVFRASKKFRAMLNHEE